MRENTRSSKERFELAHLLVGLEGRLGTDTAPGFHAVGEPFEVVTALQDRNQPVLAVLPGDRLEHAGQLILHGCASVLP